MTGDAIFGQQVALGVVSLLVADPSANIINAPGSKGENSGRIVQFNAGGMVINVLDPDPFPGLAGGERMGLRLDTDDTVIASAFGFCPDATTKESLTHIRLFDATTGKELLSLSPTDGLLPGICLPQFPLGDPYEGDVLLEGSRVIVGAPGTGEAGDPDGNYGAVYVFDAVTGIQTHKIVDSNDRVQNDFLGRFVDADEDLVAFYDCCDLIDGLFRNMIRVYDVASNQFVTSVRADPVANRIPRSLALSSRYLAIGLESGNGRPSEIVVYETASWSYVFSLMPSSGSGQLFARSIDIDGSTLIAGAPYFQDAMGNRTGAAYLFALPCSRADIVEAFGILDLQDLNTFIAAFQASDPSADFDGNGVLDLADLTGFVTEFNAGCQY